MKPVLQALVLAERVYQDVTGKKIICGTFNRVCFKQAAELVQEKKSPGGEKKLVVLGGMHAGSPYAYISMTDVVDGTQLTLQFVHLTKNVVLLERVIAVKCEDRLKTVELIVPLPPLPVAEEGVYAFEIVCEGEILGSHRIVGEELRDIPE